MYNMEDEIDKQSLLNELEDLDFLKVMLFHMNLFKIYIIN